jgi:hypothetical protein
MDPELIHQSILARNSNGQSFLHFLVDAGLQKSLIIEFLDFLKDRFGLKFVAEFLRLKNEEGLTFWSHEGFERSDCGGEDAKFSSFLEEILIKLCGNDVDFGGLKALASDLTFGRENLDGNFNEKLFDIGVLRKVDDRIKFSDDCYLIYFRPRNCNGDLEKEAIKYSVDSLCSQNGIKKELSVLTLQENCDEEKVSGSSAESLNETIRKLDHFAGIGQQQEANFFLHLDILMKQLKAEKGTENSGSLLLGQDEKKTSFLNTFCEYEDRWSDRSFRKLFKKLGELKQCVPEAEFKKLLMHRLGRRTFLHWLGKFSSFEMAFDFLNSGFGIEFLQEFLLAGKDLFRIQKSIAEFTKVLDLFQNHFDKEFIKVILMRKTLISKENFLLFYNEYSRQGNARDLLKLLQLILSICGADFELFSDLLNSKSGRDGQTFFAKLQNYKDEELKLIKDWIETLTISVKINLKL